MLPPMPSLCDGGLYKRDHGPYQSSLSGGCCITCITSFFSGAESLLLTLPGLFVAHMATHLGIHFFLSKKLPTIPCLAPELPYDRESCSHSRQVGHAGEGSAQPSSFPPRSTACPPRAYGNRCFPGYLGRFKLHLQLLQAKLLLFTHLVCATALLAAGGQNCLTLSSFCPVSVKPLSISPQHKLQHCAAQTLL